MNMLNTFYKFVQDQGDEVAVVYNDFELIYSELNNKINFISLQLAEKLNGRKQVPVVVYMHRSADFLIAMLAAHKNGCYYIPLEKPYPQKRLDEILKVLRKPIVLTDSPAEFTDDTVPISVLDFGHGYASFCTYCFDPVDMKKSDLCYIMFTSGSNGKPKGVRITCGNVMNLTSALGNILYHGIHERKNIALLSSFSFDASVKQLLAGICFGHKLVIADRKEKYFSQRLTGFYMRNNIHITDVTPSIIKILISKSSASRLQLEIMLIGGELLSWELVDNCVAYLEHSCDMYNLYGPTECCVDVAYYKIPPLQERLEKQGIVPIGHPVVNTRLLILDAEDNISNQKGELVILGNQVGDGYVYENNCGFFELQNQKAYRTGDLAQYEDDGTITILGRMNRQVKVNGYRIELDEVSSAIEIIVTGKQVYVDILENMNNTYIIAFIEENRQSSNTTQLLRKQLKGMLPQYMIPNKYIYLDSFPITDNGKLDTSLMKKKAKEFLAWKS